MKEGDWLREQVCSLGIHLTDEQLAQFEQYYHHLIETNRVMNLTAITEPHEVYVKHFYDSLTLVKSIPMKQVTALIDVGTGAGFPGIPLKIAFPHLRLVLLDSLKKRVAFLQEVVRKLQLEQVECIHGRAEEWGQKKDYRESFDLATARAVARLNVLAEYCLPFVKVNGWFVAMKGANIADEIQEAKGALKKLGQAEIKDIALTLPENMGERHLLIMEKKKQTPKNYPRRTGLPAKQPLI
ncbi:16S rRNA (guanine(527)-N(7))-methyltransferase RsmG [Thermoflavimicrobium dichotomicum]|uniref:Ribosomal RNA small subunit methyltransferase G n=1 Tax=Thermoflavimicrobium dichotomicum TaxID=46223 RepID=A0A1I3KE30_9BACL|nr:16S rRNA (guanine(527)-N(7))-methyltransferase RsmG [Thermoflavimicrobium dichotomicum]SFI70455.1 16S rRNA (guanine527-N7)-methyltransferase [Thermoflavimicrobium dichotomicum]